jgi:excisionase family DNA binding protein
MKTILQIEDLSKGELFSFIEESINNKLSSLQKEKETKGTITVQEAAKYLNVADITIHNYIKKGIIPAQKVGRKYIIKQTDLDNSLSDAKSLKYKRA